MEYLNFTKVIQNEVKEQLNPKVSVQIHQSVKNNETRRVGLMFSERGVNVSPTIYLEGYYEEYLRGKSIHSLVQKILEFYEKVKVGKNISYQSLLDFSKIKDGIMYKVIQYKSNEEMLQDMPYVRYLDLAMVFYVRVEEIDSGTLVMPIRKSHLEIWGVEQEEVVRLAKQNTQQRFPREVIKISSFLYVLTNKLCCYGASVMLYDGIWSEMKEMIGEDFYVIPSSIHELLLVPKSFGMEKEQIGEMVKEVNATEVQAEEVLSNEVYYYSVEQGELRL